MLLDRPIPRALFLKKISGQRSIPDSALRPRADSRLTSRPIRREELPLSACRSGSSHSDCGCDATYQFKPMGEQVALLRSS
jgi:hypothetical protein